MGDAEWRLSFSSSKVPSRCENGIPCSLGDKISAFAEEAEFDTKPWLGAIPVPKTKAVARYSVTSWRVFISMNSISQRFRRANVTDLRVWWYIYLYSFSETTA